MKRFSGISRYIICSLLLLGVFSAYALRLFQWQIVDGQEYYDIANTTSSSYIKLTATRGEILDRNGNALAQNKTCYNIVFDDTLIDHDHLNDTILELIGILEETDTEWIDMLPIQLNSDGSYSFKENNDSEIEFLKSSSMLHVNQYATAQECMTQLIEMFDCQEYAPEDAIKILSVRYNMRKNLFDADSPYTFAQDISADVMTVVNERAANMPGVRVDVTTTREYPDGALAPHIIGRTGRLTQDQYDSFKEEDNLFDMEDNLSGYSFDDTMGQNGIEYALEDTLRGENGKLSIETDQDGNLTSSEVEVAPEAGNTVYLTLDSRIQAVANASLAKNAKATKENPVPTQNNPKGGADCEAGAAVMIDVNTGAVLAASTYPSYDLNRYIEDIDYYNQLNNDKTYPMINRAFSGTFAPGSIFKPVVASAALQEGIIDSNSTVYCGHYYTYYTNDPRQAPKCMGWHYNTNILKALQKSCNIFFFDVGRRLGIEKLDAYGTLFGLGQKTGLEVSESPGVLTNPEDYERRSGDTWTDGMTLSAAIGQLDNSFTPLQLASYCSSIANGGHRLQLHLVDKITDYTRENTIEKKGANVLNEVGVDDKNLEIVRQGMRLVAQSGGTASNFADYGIEIGAKTGTAEVNGHSDNVTFIGFAPYDKPEIAIAVVLEYGSNSTYSKNIARDLFDAYFYGAYVDEDGEIVIPSAADTLEDEN
ncbi:MAG TPA: penicillin-binding protein [Firmicutes bacterium]|nr:penicillin-binding protein [Bacillota bacterium]